MARINSPERETVPFWKAAVTSAGLSALFLVVYGWCNWFTARRTDVPTLFFEWERLIPFVPLMIAPYMSIDLFFVAAPFLCRSNRELATFSKRIVAAILIAGLCFLLFPLRFAFECPHAAGWLGALFDWFRGIDQPYNLLPSLHIALRTILAEFYAQHTRGLLRHASNIWFVLIGLSAVLTYQHHVMDVVAGFALGAYCLYFFSSANIPSVRQQFSKNARIGFYYLAGVGLTLFFLIGSWPWGALLLYPAISFVLAAAAYFGFGPPMYGKRNGQVPWTTWWALAPVLIGQHLSRLWYRRQSPSWNELTSHVWIGGVLSNSEANDLVDRGVTSVIDLTADFDEAHPFLSVNYRNIPMLDLAAPTSDQLVEIAAFAISESDRGVVYIHCKIGYSRTAAAAAAYLLRSGRATSIPEAIEQVRAARPKVVIRPEIMEALERFAVSPRVPQSSLR